MDYYPNGRGKNACVGGSKSPKRNVPYSDAFLSFVVRERKLFCVFLFFFWLKTTTRVRKMFVFCETLIKSGCLSLMSLSSSIRSSIVSDNKDDNDDDTRGEKELRPPRILAAV